MHQGQSKSHATIPAAHEGTTRAAGPQVLDLDVLKHVSGGGPNGGWLASVAAGPNGGWATVLGPNGGWAATVAGPNGGW